MLRFAQHDSSRGLTASLFEVCDAPIIAAIKENEGLTFLFFPSPS
jgi:hypothetical protein